MMGKPDFRVVPLGTVWKEYLLACEAQKMERIPVPPPAGVAVLTDRGDFACGLCIYPTQYNVVIGEFLVTNPEIPMWERYLAVQDVAQAIKHYALCANMDLWLPIRLAGVRKAAERAGLESRGTEIYGIAR